MLHELLFATSLGGMPSMQWLPLSAWVRIAEVTGRRISGPADCQVARGRNAVLGQCLAEALRLRAPGIDVRMAAEDLHLPAEGPHGDTMLCVPRGCTLAMSPYETHLDERVYGSTACSFNPLRSGTTEFAGVAGVSGIAGIVFGGGKYR